MPAAPLGPDVVENIGVLAETLSQREVKDQFGFLLAAYNRFEEHRLVPEGTANALAASYDSLLTLTNRLSDDFGNVAMIRAERDLRWLVPFFNTRLEEVQALHMAGNIASFDSSPLLLLANQSAQLQGMINTHLAQKRATQMEGLA